MIGAVCALISWIVSLHPVSKGLENWFQDACFAYRGPRATAARIVIVALDAETPARLAQALCIRQRRARPGHPLLAQPGRRRNRTGRDRPGGARRLQGTGERPTRPRQPRLTRAGSCSRPSPSTTTASPVPSPTGGCPSRVRKTAWSRWEWSISRKTWITSSVDNNSRSGSRTGPISRTAPPSWSSPIRNRSQRATAACTSTPSRCPSMMTAAWINFVGPAGSIPRPSPSRPSSRRGAAVLRCSITRGQICNLKGALVIIGVDFAEPGRLARSPLFKRHAAGP